MSEKLHTDLAEDMRIGIKRRRGEVARTLLSIVDGLAVDGISVN